MHQAPELFSVRAIIRRHLRRAGLGEGVVMRRLAAVNVRANEDRLAECVNDIEAARKPELRRTPSLRVLRSIGGDHLAGTPRLSGACRHRVRA